jgi:hypothetical protein
MTHRRSIWRLLKSAALVVGCWAALYGTALAETTLEKPGEGGKITDYTTSYALVILGIGLGLLFVLHGSTRRERERPEGYVAKEIMKEE